MVSLKKHLFSFIIITLVLLSCEQPFKAGLGSKVDIKDPRFTNSISPVSGSFISGETAFSGNVWDDIEVIAVEVTEITGGTTVVGWLPVDSINSNGDFAWKLDTTQYGDGERKFKFRVTDNAGNITENGPLSFTIKNLPPQIRMTMPPVQGSGLGSEAGQGLGFDQDDLNVELAKSENSIYLVNGLMGMASDALGMNAEYPRIMIWPKEWLGDTDYVPVPWDGTIGDQKWGVWRKVVVPKNASSSGFAFTWPLVELDSDGAGGWKLPDNTTTAPLLQSGEYRFKIQTMDLNGNINTYPNRVDNQAGLNDPLVNEDYSPKNEIVLSPEVHPNQYFQIKAVATTAPRVNFDDGFPNNYSTTPWNDFVVDMTVLCDNNVVAVKVRIMPSQDTLDPDWTISYLSAVQIGTQKWRFTLPVNNSLLANSGNMMMYVQAEDDTGQITNSSRPFVIDNTLPSITINEPGMTPGAQITSTQDIRGILEDNQMVANLYFALGTAACGTASDYSDTVWTDTNLNKAPTVYSGQPYSQTSPFAMEWRKTLSSWEWHFNNIGDVTGNAIRNDYVIQEGAANLNLWRLPIKFKVVDTAKNVSYYTYWVIVDPDGDLPIIKVASHNNNTEHTVGGEVQLVGSATDNDIIRTIEIRVRAQTDLQIEHKDTDVSNWAILGHHAEFSTPLSSRSTNSGKSEDLGYYEILDPADLRTSSMNWTYYLNSDEKLNPLDTATDQRGVQVEIRAVDGWRDSPTTAKYYGAPQILKLKFDNTVPRIVETVIIPESGADIAYEQGANILKGRFIIRARIRDEGGLKSLKLKGQENAIYGPNLLESHTASSGDLPWVDMPPPATQLVDGNRYIINDAQSFDFRPYGADNNDQYTWFIAIGNASSLPPGVVVFEANDPETNSRYFDYWINIPINSNNAAFFVGNYLNSSGSYSVAIQAQDNASPPNTAQNTFSVRIDNFYPHATYQGVSDFVGNTTLVGEAWDTGINAKNNVAEVSRVVLYFSRGGTPISLWEKSGSYPTPPANPTFWVNNQYAKKGRTANVTTGETIDEGAIPEDGSGNLLPLSFFPNVRDGSGGWWSTDSGIVLQDVYRHNDIRNNFANWQFSADARKTWSVNFGSTRLNDGPVKLHYVVFDNADNATYYEQDIYIANGQPRIMNITLGTDINGNNTIDSGEYDSPFTVATNGDKETLTSFTVRNNLFNIKLSTLFGNGQKHYRVSYVKKIMTPSLIDPLTDPLLVDATSLVRGKVYTIATLGNTNWKQYGALDNDVGTTFVAYGPAAPATINGKAYEYEEVLSKEGSMGDTQSESATISFAAADFEHNPPELDKIPESIIGSGDVALTNSVQFIVKVWDTTDTTSPDEDKQLAHAALFNIDTDNVDETPPVAAINPFHWHSATDNSLYLNSKNKGHIELEADLPTAFTAGGSGVMDRDPKVSGAISIRGSARDNNTVGTIYFKMDGFTPGGSTAGTGTAAGYTLAASFSGGTWSTATSTDIFYATNHWKFTVTPVSHDQNGHRINWQLDLDTAYITTVAAANRAVSVVVKDIHSTTQNYSATSTTQTATGALTPYYRMDVVPYISGIETTVRNESGLKNNNIRSANGRYSVIQGANADFITVKGFNLNPAIASAVNVQVQSTAQFGSYNPSTTPSATTGTNIAFKAANATRTEFVVTNAGTKSGYLTVYTNGIGTLNNINENASHGSYTLTSSTNGLDQENMPNREADRYITKNITLTDDRYLQFYTVKKTDVKNGYNPVMIMDEDNPVFGYVDLSGGSSGTPSIGANKYAGNYQPSHAMPQRTKFDGTTAARLDTEYLIKASIWDGMGMARDESGRYIHATTYNRDGASFHLIYDRYAELHTAVNGFPPTTYTGMGWGSGTGYSDYNDRNGDWAYSNNNNAIALETVNLNNLLLDRYQYPKLIAKGNSQTSYASYYMAYFDNESGQIIFRNFRIGTSEANVGGTSNRRLSNTGADSKGNDYNSPYTSISENNGTGNTTWNTGRLIVAAGASNHFDMAVSSGNEVVIAYYDEFKGQLVIKYSSTAITGNNPTTAITWNDSPVNTSLPLYTGTYVSMVMDASNSLHIAAFDAADSDLKYIYIPNYKLNVFKDVIVDQYGSVGNWTAIKLQPTSNVPYISYYNATETGGRESIKLAYAKNAVTSVAQALPGVDSNGYTTGNWEYATVPTLDPPQGGSPKFQKVNLGFNTAKKPVLGYLGTYIEFSYLVDE